MKKMIARVAFELCRRIPGSPGFLLVSLLLVATNPASVAGAPRGVILFVGDGMGVATVTAARTHRGSLEGLEIPVSGRLTLDGAPRGGLVRTYSADRMVTDSAAAITAMLCGVKVPNGWLGMRPTPEGTPVPVETLAEAAAARGWALGIVTTTTLVHATPAGMVAHTPDRGAYSEIAGMLLPGGNPALGAGIDVVLGGGWRYFLPEGRRPEGFPEDSGEGSRDDGRDLLAEFREAGYAVVHTAGDLERARSEGVGRILGAFSRGHMDYEHDRDRNPAGQPSLAEMTRVALEVLTRDEEGFLLLVEGGRIDHALHDCNAYRAVMDMLALDDAVKVALEEAGPETAILVTADHDHTMVIAGYPPATDGIFGFAGTDREGEPYTTLLFATGDGSQRQPEGGLTPEAAADGDYHQRSGIPLGGETHGGMDVPLYAWGPRWFLDTIPGSLENTEIHDLLLRAIHRE